MIDVTDIYAKHLPKIPEDWCWRIRQDVVDQESVTIVYLRDAAGFARGQVTVPAWNSVILAAQIIAGGLAYE